MTHTYTLEALADIVGGTLRTGGDARVTGVADVDCAGPDDATFVTDAKYASRLASSRAAVALVGHDVADTPMPAIECPHMPRAVARLLAAFAPDVAGPPSGVHPTAVVHDTAVVGPGAAIGPHVVIGAGTRIGASCVMHAGVYVGRDCTIGAGCVLWPHAVVRERCVLGDRVTLHPHAVVGADGFGFYFDAGRHERVPHIGAVILEDDVEIGACACVDRAKVGHTVVGRGTKIDNHVQVAHNVHIGEHCVIAGQAGISGSARIGDFCTLAGRAGVIDHVQLADRVTLATTAVATRDFPAGVTASGTPAREHRKAMREQAAVRRLPALIEQVRDLLARVKRLETSMHHKPGRRA
ncbi:MAG: UDP-3-O-(3-hydroxymyristoyl)glucosamine N-acyltransferase [Phycisphaerae bacterium]